jgi:hypothetical protein
MPVKSPLGRVLYCYLNMPTINKTYLILSYLILSYLIVSYRILSYRIVSYRIVSYCKEAIDQYIQDTSQVFQVWHNLCSELTSMWTFNMYSRNTKTTNEPTASNNKSDRTQMNIWDIWKTLKYLNINENRKHGCRYNYVVFSFVNCGLFELSEH